MYDYLRDVLFSSDSLTEKQIKEIFLKILKDYFEKKIDITTLSDLSSRLLYEITNPPLINSFNDELFSSAIHFSSDVCFYAENQNLGENRKTYKEFMETIKEYYRKNKNLVK